MKLNEAFRLQNKIDILIEETSSLLLKGCDDREKKIEFLNKLLEEKEKLYFLCKEAKEKLDFDLDIQKAMNSKRHQVIRVLEYLNDKENLCALNEKADDISRAINVAILTTEVSYTKPDFLN